MNNRKEICICGHSKNSHVNDFNNTRCCACWKSKLNGDTRMCDCMKYCPEDEKARISISGEDSLSKEGITYALKSNSNKLDGNLQDLNLNGGGQ